MISRQWQATSTRVGCLVGRLPWGGPVVWWRKVNRSDVVDPVGWCCGAGRMVGSLVGFLVVMVAWSKLSYVGWEGDEERVSCWLWR